MADLQNPIFHDDDKARAWLEAQVWPDGPFCPHCGSTGVTKLRGKAHRPGVYQCNDCRQQLTVTVGTLFESSKIPLSKWLLATYLLCASKKGMSTRQLSRMLGVSVKSTWFMMHRIRESMREGGVGPLGGSNKVVEVDETFVGGKAKNKAFGPPPKKEPVVALVERDGSVRSFHIEAVSSATLRPILVREIDRASYLMTDEARYYKRTGREFSGHGTVVHSIDQYVRHGGFTHTNTIEGYFAIFKRGIMGNYHWVSSKHLKRYLGEFDFRFNSRDVTDFERAARAAQGIVGKRLTYRRTGERQTRH